MLRGFDEESIYASRFAVTTGEYRYLIGRYSYLFTFIDFGWARNTASSGNISNTFFGTGAGMALESKAGIFNISFTIKTTNRYISVVRLTLNTQPIVLKIKYLPD